MIRKGDKAEKEREAFLIVEFYRTEKYSRKQIYARSCIIFMKEKKEGGADSYTEDTNTQRSVGWQSN